MRAIMIDAEHQIISEFDFFGGFEEIIGCDEVDVWHDVIGLWNDGSCDALYMSGDRLGEFPKHWFQIGADHDPPIAGCGLVVGFKIDGKHDDARIGIEALTKRITFLRSWAITQANIANAKPQHQSGSGRED